MSSLKIAVFYEYGNENRFETVSNCFNLRRISASIAYIDTETAWNCYEFILLNFVIFISDK